MDGRKSNVQISQNVYFIDVRSIRISSQSRTESEMFVGFDETATPIFRFSTFLLCLFSVSCRNQGGLKANASELMYLYVK